jgi:amidase
MSIQQAYSDNDAVGLAALVRAKEVSPLELCEEAVARVEATNKTLNAVVVHMYEYARNRISKGLPDGPLAGVPYLMKELGSAMAGFPQRGASRIYMNYVPNHSSELVKRYEAAGLVIFGKTNSSEWGILPTVESELYGACHNPWKLGTTSGGSSGGAASVVAARVVPAAHAGDAGGSIRIPASCCGVFGMKPTRNRTPHGPDQSERAHGLAAEHAITVSVRDSAALLDATEGPEVTSAYYAPPKPRPYVDEVGRDPGKLRIAFTYKPILPADEHPDTRAAVLDAADLLRSLGHDVEEKHPPIDGPKIAKSFFTLYCSAVGGELELSSRITGREPTPDDVEPATWLMGMIARNVLSAAQLSAAIRELQTVARDVANFMQDYDVMLTPSLGKPPVPHGTLGLVGFQGKVQKFIAKNSLSPLMRIPGILDRAVARAYAFAPFTQVANVTGQPSMNVPLYWNPDGLPIGVSMTGRFGEEGLLFRLASQLEVARPWRDRIPQINGMKR